MRDTTMASRASATGGGPVVSRDPVRVLLLAACALVLVAPNGARAATRTHAPPSVATHAPLRFAGLAWDADRAAVASRLAAAGFRRVTAEGDDTPAWRGAAWGVRGRVVPEFDAAGRLLAVELRCESAASGGAVGRYADLVARVRAEFGPWEVQVAPGRHVREQHMGRYGVTRRFGERTAATLWTGDDGVAAAVQLGGDDVITVRFESPRWNAERAGADSTAW